MGGLSQISVRIPAAELRGEIWRPSIQQGSSALARGGFPEHRAAWQCRAADCAGQAGAWPWRQPSPA